MTYNRDELIRDLNEVVKYDWAGFLHQRIDLINPHADLDGITRGGYKLVYQDHPSASEKTLTGTRRYARPDLWYSLGLRVAKDGTLSDVRWGGPGDKAKLAPGQKIIAVNGRTVGAAGEDQDEQVTAFQKALAASKGNTEPIHLIVQSESYVKAVDIDYHDGERYPTLVRDETQKDYLDEITKPLTAVSSGTTGSAPNK